MDEIITHYAKVAQGNKGEFEELVKATAFKKVYSSRLDSSTTPITPKALTRIKEKMFFGKE